MCKSRGGLFIFYICNIIFPFKNIVTHMAHPSPIQLNFFSNTSSLSGSLQTQVISDSSYFPVKDSSMTQFHFSALVCFHLMPDIQMQGRKGGRGVTVQAPKKERGFLMQQSIFPCLQPKFSSGEGPLLTQDRTLLSENSAPH